MWAVFEDTALAGGGRLDASLNVDEERRVIGWLWWSGSGIGGWGDVYDDDELAFGMIQCAVYTARKIDLPGQ